MLVAVETGATEARRRCGPARSTCGGAAQATAELQAVLSPAESIRAARFHFDRDRLRYIAGRGILRHVLAGYLASSRRTCASSRGLRQARARRFDTSLHFNLSHSDDLMLSP